MAGLSDDSHGPPRQEEQWQHHVYTTGFAQRHWMQQVDAAAKLGRKLHALRFTAGQRSFVYQVDVPHEHNASLDELVTLAKARYKPWAQNSPQKPPLQHGLSLDSRRHCTTQRCNRTDSSTSDNQPAGDASQTAGSSPTASCAGLTIHHNPLNQAHWTVQSVGGSHQHRTAYHARNISNPEDLSRIDARLESRPPRAPSPTHAKSARQTYAGSPFARPSAAGSILTSSQHHVTPTCVACHACGTVNALAAPTQQSSPLQSSPHALPPAPLSVDIPDIQQPRQLRTSHAPTHSQSSSLAGVEVTGYVTTTATGTPIPCNQPHSARLTKQQVSVGGVQVLQGQPLVLPISGAVTPCPSMQYEVVHVGGPWSMTDMGARQTVDRDEQVPRKQCKAVTMCKRAPFCRRLCKAVKVLCGVYLLGCCKA